MGSITLSFDNGPGGSTEMVLDTLEQFGIMASFFVIGSRLNDSNLQLLEQAHARGHWIGNHTWSHSAPLGTLSAAGFARDEIERTQEALEGLAHEARFFRPVGGEGGGVISPLLLNSEALETLLSGHYTMVLWNAVPRDWENPRQWVETALRQTALQEHSVVVVHDRENGAMELLGEFVDRALQRGSKFRQDFSGDVTPIVRGVPVSPVEGFVTRSGQPW